MKTLTIAALATSLLATPSFAQSRGDMTLGLGLGYVHPKDNNGKLAGGKSEVGDSTRPIVTFEYFVWENIGIEVLGAVPFRHKIKISGSHIGKTKHLPPTVSVNYHIPTGGPLTPYLGVGINYTTFFDEKSSLGNLKIKDSWGIAANAGVDYAISDRGALRLGVRYIDIKSDVKLNGSKIGKVKVDPIVATASYVFKF